MAIRCSTPNIVVPRNQVNKTMTRVSMLHSSNMQPTKASTFLSKSSMVNKVFEDQATGIVCYRDEKGEVICEGYDEGPRFSRQPSHKIYHQRHKEVQILDFQQKRWFQIVEDADFYHIKGVSVREQN